MSDTRTENVIKNSSATLLFKVVQIVSQFALRTVFIYVLGREYTGIQGLFTDILNVLSLMELGLDGSMVFSLYKPLAEGNDKKVSAYVNFYRKAFGAIGVIVFLSGLICLPFLNYIITDAPDISENLNGIFMMYVITSASSYFLVYKTTLLQADQKARTVSLVSAAFQLVEGILEIIALAFFKAFYSYLILHLIGTVGRNIVLSNMTNNRYRHILSDRESKLTREETKSLVIYIAALCVYNLSGVVINSTDSIFISAFVGTAEVAIIGNFTLIISNIRKLIQNIVKSTKPSVGNLAATSTVEKQKEIFSEMNFISFWVGCICCSALFVLLNPFVGDIWFDSSYKTTLPILSVLVINFYIAVMVYPVETFREGNGIVVQGWYRPLIMAILNIALDFVMGKRWGVFGIFLATTISRLLTQVWFDIYLLSKIIFHEFPGKYYVDYIFKMLLTILSCAISYIVASYSLGNVFFDFVSKIVIVLVVPNILIFIVYRKSKELQYLLKFAYKVMKRVTIF